MERKPGIYLWHKPVGRTSFQVVQEAVRDAPRLGSGRLPVCHGGTLDPFAEGLLLILVGPMTRAFEALHQLPKRYEATLRWGIATDNGDPTGQVVEQKSAVSLSPGVIEEAAAHFLGWHDQVPPATSAKKVGGEPAYRRAHRGQPVALPASRVYLHQVRVLAQALPERTTLELVCRGGFYVRSFATDLGRVLQCPVHVEALSRTVIGPWRDVPPTAPRRVPWEDCFGWCATRRLSDAELGRLRRGREIEAGVLEPALWQAPEGYPPITTVRGTHEGRTCVLLSDRGPALAVDRWLDGRNGPRRTA